MTLNKFPLYALFFSLPLLLLASFSTIAVEQPNILLIISDDAGYHDFGFQGSKVMKTPSIDGLAKQSVIFKQAYVSAAVCGPSRAGLLTGKYQQRFGFEENNVPGFMSPSGLMGDEMGLPLDQLTMADHLKSLNYATGLIGKWHMGDADEYHPLKRGFDYFFGFRNGARSYWAYDAKEQQERENEKLELNFENYQEHTGYLTDVLADKTIDFIQRNVKKQQPFFSVLSFSAVHAPMEAKPEDLAQFPNLTGTRKTLAAMNLSMDQAVGRVITALDKLNIAENTLVVFMNDNGGPTDQNASNNFPLSATKASHYEGGIRVPFLMRWPAKVKSALNYNYPISTLDLLPTFYSAAGGDIAHLNGIDGVDLLPFLTASKTTKLAKNKPHQTLYWKKENRGAIRDGDWKLMRFPDRPAELYNLSVDASEKSNLADKNPLLVRALYKKLFEWELTLERPLWQLKREYEGAAMKRMDNFRTFKQIK